MRKLFSLRANIARLFGLTEKAEIRAVIQDLHALFERCALFVNHVDSNASVAKQRRMLEQLLRQRWLAYDDIWALDAAVVNRIAAHLRGGGLRLASRRIPPLELRGAMIRALGSIGLIPRGRPADTDSLALRQFALGLARIWAEHSGQPMSRLWRCRWIVGQGMVTEEYGPFRDFVALAMELVPQHLRTTGKGALRGIDYTVRLAIGEYKVAMTCRAPHRRRGLISNRLWLGPPR